MLMALQYPNLERQPSGPSRLGIPVREIKQEDELIKSIATSGGDEKSNIVTIIQKSARRFKVMKIHGGTDTLKAVRLAFAVGVHHAGMGPQLAAIAHGDKKISPKVIDAWRVIMRPITDIAKSLKDNEAPDHEELHGRYVDLETFLDLVKSRANFLLQSVNPRRMELEGRTNALGVSSSEICEQIALFCIAPISEIPDLGALVMELQTQRMQGLCRLAGLSAVKQVLDVKAKVEGGILGLTSISDALFQALGTPGFDEKTRRSSAGALPPIDLIAEHETCGNDLINDIARSYFSAVDTLVANLLESKESTGIHNSNSYNDGSFGNYGSSDLRFNILCLTHLKYRHEVLVHVVKAEKIFDLLFSCLPLAHSTPRPTPSESTVAWGVIQTLLASTLPREGCRGARPQGKDGKSVGMGTESGGPDFVSFLENDSSKRKIFSAILPRLSVYLTGLAHRIESKDPKSTSAQETGQKSISASLCTLSNARSIWVTRTAIGGADGEIEESLCAICQVLSLINDTFGQIPGFVTALGQEANFFLQFLVRLVAITDKIEDKGLYRVTQLCQALSLRLLQVIVPEVHPDKLGEKERKSVQDLVENLLVRLGAFNLPPPPKVKRKGSTNEKEGIFTEFREAFGTETSVAIAREMVCIRSGLSSIGYDITSLLRSLLLPVEPDNTTPRNTAPPGESQDQKIFHPSESNQESETKLESKSKSESKSESKSKSKSRLSWTPIVFSLITDGLETLPRFVKSLHDISFESDGRISQEQSAELISSLARIIGALCVLDGQSTLSTCVDGQLVEVNVSGSAQVGRVVAVHGIPRGEGRDILTRRFDVSLSDNGQILASVSCADIRSIPTHPIVLSESNTKRIVELIGETLKVELPEHMATFPLSNLYIVRLQRKALEVVSALIEQGSDGKTVIMEFIRHGLFDLTSTIAQSNENNSFSKFKPLYLTHRLNLLSNHTFPDTYGFFDGDPRLVSKLTQSSEGNEVKSKSTDKKEKGLNTGPDGAEGKPDCEDSQWSCGTCTFIQPMGNVMCTMCGAPKPKTGKGVLGMEVSPKSSVAEKPWSVVCKVCTLINDLRTNETGRCQICEEPLPLTPANSKFASTTNTALGKKQKQLVGGKEFLESKPGKAYALSILGFPEQWAAQSLDKSEGGDLGAVRWLVANKEALVDKDFRLWERFREGKVLENHNAPTWMRTMTATESEAVAPARNPAFHILNRTSEKMVIRGVDDVKKKSSRGSSPMPTNRKRNSKSSSARLNFTSNTNIFLDAKQPSEAASLTTADAHHSNLTTQIPTDPNPTPFTPLSMSPTNFGGENGSGRGGFKFISSDQIADLDADAVSYGAMGVVKRLDNRVLTECALARHSAKSVITNFLLYLAASDDMSLLSMDGKSQGSGSPKGISLAKVLISYLNATKSERTELGDDPVFSSASLKSSIVQTLTAECASVAHQGKGVGGGILSQALFASLCPTSSSLVNLLLYQILEGFKSLYLLHGFTATTVRSELQSLPGGVVLRKISLVEWGINLFGAVARARGGIAARERDFQFFSRLFSSHIVDGITALIISAQGEARAEAMHLLATLHHAANGCIRLTLSPNKRELLTSFMFQTHQGQRRTGGAECFSSFFQALVDLNVAVHQMQKPSERKEWTGDRSWFMDVTYVAECFQNHPNPLALALGNTEGKGKISDHIQLRAWGSFAANQNLEEFLRVNNQLFTRDCDEELVELVNRIYIKKGASHHVTKPKELRLSKEEMVQFPNMQARGIGYKERQFRFYVLSCLNQLVHTVLPLINLSLPPGKSALADGVRSAREIIFWSTKERLWSTALRETRVRKRDLTVNIDKVRAAKLKQDEKSDKSGTESVFGQLMRAPALQRAGPTAFRIGRNERAFRVVEVGFNSQDIGGPYRDTMEAITRELQSNVLPLFVPCINAKLQLGRNRDVWVPAPMEFPESEIRMYEFVGKLMGLAIRTLNYHSFRFSELVWKPLVWDTVTKDDVKAVDALAFKNLDLCISLEQSSSPEQFNKAMFNNTFTAVNTAGETVNLIRNGSQIPITWSNRSQYKELFKRFKLTETEEQCEAIRRGLATIVPYQLLSLFTWRDLQDQVCGRVTIDVKLLESITRYAGPRRLGRGFLDRNSPHVRMFWQMLNERMDNFQRSKLIFFVWGRSRLPVNRKGFERGFTIMAHTLSQSRGKNPDDYLPVAHTCFFQLELPEYSSIEVMFQRMMYACTHCTSIDGDNTAAAREAARTRGTAL